MENIKSIFSSLIGNNSFCRVDENHILDIYLGLDNLARYTLFYISESEPPVMLSSQIISVEKGLRKDNRWGVSFTLLNDKFKDIFISFCYDLVESSRGQKDKIAGSKYLCSRYKSWQNMLAKYKEGLLSSAAIKGLIGELYFLQKFLIPLYGEDIAVNSWIGPELADQDFVCQDTWYEVKATVSGNESIKISSIEQLDCEKEGELVIVYLDKTSSMDYKRISLNSIYKEIYNSIKSETIKIKLNEIVLNLGYYYHPEYDEYLYKYSGLERFDVTDKFPALRRKNLPYSIVNATYNISIASIKQFMKE